MGDESPTAELIGRARSYENLAQWLEAQECFAAAFRLATAQRNLGAMSSSLLGTARTHLHLHGAEAAEEVAGLAMEIGRAANRIREAARAQNLIGAIQHQTDRLADAEASYRQAHLLAQDAGDDELIAAVAQNLGVIANIRGDSREARALYLEGISASVRAHSQQMAASSYNNLGLVSADLGEWTEAEVHFLRGIEIAERLGDRSLQARILTGRAEPLVRTGEFERARRSLAQAEELARDLGDDKSLADVHRFRGMSARLQGRPEEAEEHLDRSLATAREAKLELEEAEALEELARLRESQGRNGPARVVLREARRLFESLGARRDVERVEALAAELAGAGGAG